MAAFTWPVRVYYEDTDSGGMVYHANHLRYFERARTELLRSLGFEQDVLRDEFGIVFVVHSLEIRYLKPVGFNSQLQIMTRITGHRRASLVFDQRILSDDMQQTYCLATVRVACVDAHSQAPRAIPEAMNAEMFHAR